MKNLRFFNKKFDFLTIERIIEITGAKPHKDCDLNFKIIETCVKNGLIVDWFLFNSHSMRISPPLIITDDEIKNACSIIMQSIQECV